MKNQKTLKKNFNNIAKKYFLCDFCSLRLTSKKPKRKNQKCFICKNIFEQSDNIITRILDAVSLYDFTTFELGIVLKPSVLDRDDHIKSQFQIKGVSSIKADINHQLSKVFSHKTNTKISHIDPDLIIQINMKDDSYEIYSKPTFIYGRYIKNIRTLTQKQRKCNNCSGKGCHACNFHGLKNFNSVEGRITEFLIRKFDCKQVKINWLGGEEKSSLVFGNGRPFFAKIINPKKRKRILRRRIKLNGIELIELRKILEPPKNPIYLKSKVSISIKTENAIRSNVLNNLAKLQMPLEIQMNERKVSIKKLYKIRAKKISSNFLKIELDMDSGVPIRKLIQNTTITPNFTNLLKTKCECILFDFKKIDVVS